MQRLWKQVAFTHVEATLEEQGRPIPSFRPSPGPATAKEELFCKLQRIQHTLSRADMDAFLHEYVANSFADEFRHHYYAYYDVVESQTGQP